MTSVVVLKVVPDVSIELLSGFKLSVGLGVELTIPETVKTSFVLVMTDGIVNASYEVTFICVALSETEL